MFEELKSQIADANNSVRNSDSVNMTHLRVMLGPYATAYELVAPNGRVLMTVIGKKSIRKTSAAMEALTGVFAGCQGAKYNLDPAQFADLFNMIDRRYIARIIAARSCAYVR